MRFRNRLEAGRLLGEKLESYRRDHPFILGLARGGVPVAMEVARTLDTDLDVLVVRKIGAPSNPEYAIGAIAEGGAVYVRREALDDVGLGDEDVADLAEREAIELARRVRIYRGGRPLPDLAGRTVIVVDDGVATGATAHAAARAARARGASRVVLAAPVIAAASAPAMRAEFDDVVAVEMPHPFIAVGLWYEQFGQTSDEEVLACLRGGRREPAGVGDERWNGEWTGPGSSLAFFGPDPEALRIPFELPYGSGVLEADLFLPEAARILVMFVHGSGSTRQSSRNRFVAQALQRAGLGTLLFDLLTPEEAAEDERTARYRFDVGMLTARVMAVTRWISTLPRARGLRLVYFGASTGAAAALAAAAELGERVAGVVSRGGRPDLVPVHALERVGVPVLLVVGARDAGVLDLNRSALRHLGAAELAIVPGATHLFEEPGALGAVARLVVEWVAHRFTEPVALEPPAVT